MIAYTVGRACALGVLRLPAVRLVFASQFALGACLAELTFHALGANASIGDPGAWLDRSLRGAPGRA